MLLGYFMNKCDYLGIDFCVYGDSGNIKIGSDDYYQFIDCPVVDISIYFEDRFVKIYI